MKPSAIISLIIGVILILVGVILCTSADTTAKINGYNLHESLFDSNGNITNDYSFSLSDDINVTKISVTFDNADITVIGGSDRSYIRIENLLPGQYGCYISNKVITVTNHMDLSTIADSAGNLEFNGIRQYLDTNLLKPRKTKVYVYIDETSEVIKQIALNVKNCTVDMRNVSGSLDFRIQSSKSTVTLTDCITDSCLYVDDDSSSYTVTNFEFRESDFSLKNSSLNFDSSLIILYRFIISADETPFRINGEEYSGSFSYNNEYRDYPLINISSETSDIGISVSQDVTE